MDDQKDVPPWLRRRLAPTDLLVHFPQCDEWDHLLLAQVEAFFLNEELMSVSLQERELLPLAWTLIKARIEIWLSR